MSIKLDKTWLPKWGQRLFSISFSSSKIPTLNAFAVPGGYVFLNTGMILRADREEEMAGVMAHEVSHIYCRHMAQMVEKSRLVTVASIVGAIASAFLGGGMAQPLIMGAMGGGQTAMLAYSREFEAQADAMGFKWMLAAGYNPEGMVSMFKKMNKERWYEGGTRPRFTSKPILSPMTASWYSRIKWRFIEKSCRRIETIPTSNTSPLS